MGHKVLILDDDADFNSLLTDIFEQADYDVTSIEDPLVAIEVFKDSNFDLVVTDHKMPEMTGTEFMKRIKEMKPKVPVIMVSGYLENDAIRDLISDGVGGVFLKPLNIFSLLERTNELLEEAKKMNASSKGSAVEESSAPSGTVNLEFRFRSFPCKSDVSLNFAERLYSLRNFKSTLSLVGEPGMHYKQICEDIAGFYDAKADTFLYFDRGNFNASDVLKRLQDAEATGVERITCVIEFPETFSDEQKQLAVDLPKGSGVFDAINANLRAIFCVSGDLDNLFDNEVIDENLYILMGTAEVRVPAIRQCANDIPVMAQKLAVDSFRELGKDSVPRIDQAAKDFLRKQPWNENYDGLRLLVRKAMELTSGDTITLNSFQTALSGGGGNQIDEREAFLMELSEIAVEYLSAAWQLADKDSRKTADVFGTSGDLIEQRLGL